ncbi:MAG TPA: CoA-binding protein [Verrucomicrobiota bacterium]|nr:CoA-binding protein [Verrucomicrobiales bacterium]HRI14866.1 CoA-binding protein [Verrucomicrobiota bacterium]
MSTPVKTVAVIGASANRAKYGNKAVRAYRQNGYHVFPINPHERQIEGLPAYASVRDTPKRPDLVSVYVPPEVLFRLLPEIAARGCDELWLNPGTESPEVIAEAERVGLNVVQACSIMAVGRISR